MHAQFRYPIDLNFPHVKYAKLRVGFKYRAQFVTTNKEVSQRMLSDFDKSFVNRPQIDTVC